VSGEVVLRVLGPVAAEGTLASNLRDLGADHPQTLAARDMLARCYRVVGRLAEIIGLHEENLQARQRVLGPDHPDTLMSGNDLARTYRLAARHEDAIGLHERVLASQQDHPDTRASQQALAQARAHRRARARPWRRSR
jgi:hypothetical protein